MYVDHSANFLVQSRVSIPISFHDGPNIMISCWGRVMNNMSLNFWLTAYTTFFIGKHFVLRQSNTKTIYISTYYLTQYLSIWYYEVATEWKIWLGDMTWKSETFWPKPSLKIGTANVTCWNSLESSQNFNSIRQQIEKIEIKIVWMSWMSWNFVRFHEILFQTDAENFSFLSWKIKKFYS